MKRGFENHGEIVGARIPDDDMPGWIELLHEMGLDQGEIDRILIHLNERYAQLKNTKAPEKIDEKDEMDFVFKAAEADLGRTLTEKEKDIIREKIHEDLTEAMKALGFDVDDDSDK